MIQRSTTPLKSANFHVSFFYCPAFNDQWTRLSSLLDSLNVPLGSQHILISQQYSDVISFLSLFYHSSFVRYTKFVLHTMNVFYFVNNRRIVVEANRLCFTKLKWKNCLELRGRVMVTGRRSTRQRSPHKCLTVTVFLLLVTGLGGAAEHGRVDSQSPSAYHVTVGLRLGSPVRNAVRQYL